MSPVPALRVVVTGLGTVNAVGSDVAMTWQNLLAGKSGIGRINRFDPQALGLKTWIAGEIARFPEPAFDFRQSPELLDRFSQLAVVAAHEALEQAGLEINAENADQVGVVLGSALGGVGSLDEAILALQERGSRRVPPLMFPRTMSNASAAAVSLYSGARGPVMSLNTACASATDAIGLATDLIRAGRADVVLAGGSESAILPVMIAALDRMGALVSSFNAEPERASRPFERARDGFVMAEGGAVLVLESETHALARGAKVLAELAGYGISADAHHLTAPDPAGRQALRAMRLALNNAGASPDDVVHINAHGTSTRLNDAVEARIIRELLGIRTEAVPVSATKSVTGHMGGATGALEALFCVQSCLTGLAPPTLNYEEPDPECLLDVVHGAARSLPAGLVLSNSFGFGGHCSCLAFRPFRGR